MLRKGNTPYSTYGTRRAAHMKRAHTQYSISIGIVQTFISIYEYLPKIPENLI